MFEDATLERAGLLQSHQSKSVPPFLVVASNDLNQVNPSLLQSCNVVYQSEQEVVNLVHHLLGGKAGDCACVPLHHLDLITCHISCMPGCSLMYQCVPWSSLPYLQKVSGCTGQTFLEGEDLSCTYLSHPDLKSIMIVLFTLAVGFASMHSMYE